MSKSPFQNVRSFRQEFLAGGTLPFANVQFNDGVCKVILTVPKPQMKLVRHYKLVTPVGHKHRGHHLRYRLDRCTPQTNAPKLPVLHSPYNFIIPPGSNVRRVFPYDNVISSRHAARVGSGRIDLPCPLQFVCQRHAVALAPCRVSLLGGRHGHHIHVPQADAARQLLGVIFHLPSTVVM